MALKSVVNDRFFVSTIASLQALQNARGGLHFATLTSSLSHAGHWKLTLAADWIDALSPLRASAEIREFLKPRLDGNSDRLDGVIIRDMQDRLVRTFTSSLDIPELGTAYQVLGLELEDFHLDEAVCLLARPFNHYLHARSA